MWTRLSWRLSIVARLGTPSERVERIILGSFKKTTYFRSLVDRDESFILVSCCENGNSPTRTRRMRGVYISKTIGRARRSDPSVQRDHAGEMCVWWPLSNLSNTAVRPCSDNKYIIPGVYHRDRPRTKHHGSRHDSTGVTMTSWQHTTSVYPSKRMLPLPIWN